MKKTFAKILAFSLVAIMMCSALVACSLFGPNSDPEKAKEALEDADYEVLYASNAVEAVFLGGWYDGCEAAIAAGKDDEAIWIWYFEDKDDAADAWEKGLKDYAEEIEEEAKEEDVDVVVKKSGKMIYIGTKAAVKAAK